MNIYENVYDNPNNEDGTPKPNTLLGEFDLLEGDINDYSYEAIVMGKKDGKVYKLRGKEVSGFYHPNEGGTRNTLIELSECPDVKAYLRYQPLLTLSK